MAAKRLFLGLDLPAELKEKIIELQNKLKKTGSDVKWVEPENFHFCLKFFGSIAEPAEKKVLEAVSAVLKTQEPFSVKIEGLGAFPNQNSIRVVWVGATNGADNLAEFANKLDEALGKQGFEKEKRPFTPHITLGRMSAVHKSETKDLLKTEIIHNKYIIIGEFKVKDLVLFESKLSPKGPKYEKLKVWVIQ